MVCLPGTLYFDRLKYSVDTNFMLVIVRELLNCEIVQMGALSSK